MHVYFYEDEVTPGNAVGEVNDRKIQCCYWSWAEWGFPRLNDDFCWMTLSVIRASEVAKIPG
eukprot:8472122-Pyramimonas_sp.AAC.1